MQIQIVLTTLDSRKMNELPVYMGAASCRGRLSKSMGQGCIYDPPGYPTYFLQSIYNRSGDVDNDMPSGVIVWNGEKRIVGKSANDCGTNWNEEYHQLLRDLWVKLPYNHPRVQAWIKSCYAYFGGLWVDTAGSRNCSDLILWPSRNCFLQGNGKKWGFVGKFSPWYTGNKKRTEYIKWLNERKRVGKENAKLKQHVKSVVADVHNYRPYDYVHSFYPEHEPNLEYMKNRPAYGIGGTGDWWERCDYVSVENCPEGHFADANGKLFGKKGWCQFCGGYDQEVYDACMEARKK